MPQLVLFDRLHLSISIIGFCVLFAISVNLQAEPQSAPVWLAQSDVDETVEMIAKAGRPEPVNRDEEMEAEIIQALDRPISLELDDVPIRKAVGAFSEKAGIPIRVAAGTLGLLPYGSQTKLSARIEEQPFGLSLSAILLPLGLEYEPAGAELLIKPTQALRRIADRAAWEELELIHKLYSQPWSEELAESLKFQFRGMPTGDAEANRQTLLRLAASVGAGSAAEVLEHASAQYGWTWHPDGERVVILTQTQQIEEQLDRRINKLRYNNIDVREALLDLANRAGVLLQFEPGALVSAGPTQTNRFSLTLENTTIRQAFEIIAGETGLSYIVEPGGVRITASALLVPGNESPDAASQAQATAQETVRQLRSNPIIGQYMIPMPDGTTVSLFLRENDLTEEAKGLRKQRLEAAGRQIEAVLQKPLVQK